MDDALRDTPDVNALLSKSYIEGPKFRMYGDIDNIQNDNGEVRQARIKRRDVDEKYVDDACTKIETRTFYVYHGEMQNIYKEIFITNTTYNKYISKLVDENGNELGERVYANKTFIATNSDDNHLEYMTVYKNKNSDKWDILEHGLNYSNIASSCLASKNQTLIGANISGMQIETIIFNVAVSKSQHNENVVIYNNKSNMQETVFNNGWFKDKTKTTLLEELGFINTNNRGNTVINDDYQNKLILVPVSQDGHATTMIVDTHDAGNNGIDKIKLGLFDSSFYHRNNNPFSEHLRRDIFGNKLSKEIKLLSKTDTNKDISMFFKDDNTRYNINTNFGYLQENGTCAYWQRAFIKVIATNNTYNSLKEIQENIDNGNIIKQICLELDNIFIPHGVFKANINNLEDTEQRDYIRVDDNFYINKKLAHKNQFANLAKLQQRLGYPEELDCNDFNEEIRKQKVLREKLELVAPYLKIDDNIYYLNTKKNRRKQKNRVRGQTKLIRAYDKEIAKCKKQIELLKNIKNKYVNTDTQQAVSNIKTYIECDNTDFLLLENTTCKSIPFFDRKRIDDLEKAILKDAEITKTKYKQQDFVIHNNVTRNKSQQNDKQLDCNNQKRQEDHSQLQQNSFANLQQIINSKLPGIKSMQIVNKNNNVVHEHDAFKQIQPQPQQNAVSQQQELAQNQHNFSPEFSKIKKIVANKLGKTNIENTKQTNDTKQNQNIESELAKQQQTVNTTRQQVEQSIGNFF